MALTITNPYVPKAHVYTGQTHAHNTLDWSRFGADTTPLSDEDGGRYLPGELIEWYKALGYHYLCLTSHAFRYPFGGPRDTGIWRGLTETGEYTANSRTYSAPGSDFDVSYIWYEEHWGVNSAGKYVGLDFVLANGSDNDTDWWLGDPTPNACGGSVPHEQPAPQSRGNGVIFGRFNHLDDQVLHEGADFTVTSQAIRQFGRTRYQLTVHFSRKALPESAAAGQRSVVVSTGSEYSIDQPVLLGDALAMEANAVSARCGDTLTMQNKLASTYTPTNGAYISHVVPSTSEPFFVAYNVSQEYRNNPANHAFAGILYQLSIEKEDTNWPHYAEAVPTNPKTHVTILGNLTDFSIINKAPFDVAGVRPQDVVNFAHAQGCLAFCNHPVLAVYHETIDQIESIPNWDAIEIFNSKHPGLGPGESCADVWDQVLTYFEPAQRVWAIASDDASYQIGDPYNNSGGWPGLTGIDIFADALTWDEIKQNISTGNFYAWNASAAEPYTTVPRPHIRITGITVADGCIAISADRECTFYWTDSTGAIRQTSKNTTYSSYCPQGEEGFVYLRLVQSQPCFLQTWTQPFVVSRTAPSP